MGKLYDHLPDNLVEWTRKQHMFWVATAPLSEDGHVNLSPKVSSLYIPYLRSELILQPSVLAQASCRSRTSGSYTRISLEAVRDFFTQSASREEELTFIIITGVETIAHIRENKRITLLFHAFEGPPRLCRVFGTGWLVYYLNQRY
jgi:hypothetical protein